MREEVQAHELERQAHELENLGKETVADANPSPARRWGPLVFTDLPESGPEILKKAA